MTRTAFSMAACVLGLAILAGCGAPAANTNIATSNTNTRNNNLNTSNINSSNTAASSIEAKEPDKYQALVKVNFEAVGDQQKTTLPALSAVVSRSGGDRRMEFALANGEKVVYLDTAGANYLILPNRKQYAELSKETVGFEIRRMLMPAQIVDQVKGLQGVERVGEETVNGRRAIKYRYASVANTQTRAGQVGTESYLLVDEETGLPLRSETLSQSRSGGNVQGYNGARIVTEMSDINMNPNEAQFAVPTDFARIDADQVKAQAALIFNAFAAIVGQAVHQQQPAQPQATVTATPVR